MARGLCGYGVGDPAVLVERLGREQAFGGGIEARTVTIACVVLERVHQREPVCTQRIDLRRPHQPRHDEVILTQRQHRVAGLQRARVVREQGIDRVEQPRELRARRLAAFDRPAFIAGGEIRRGERESIALGHGIDRTTRGGKFQRRDEFLRLLTGIEIPAVPREAPAIRNAQCQRAIGTQCRQHFRQRSHILQREIEHVGVTRKIVASGDARDLLAVGRQHHHGRIAEHLELFAGALRARCIAIQVHRHELPQLVLEITPRKHMRLQVMARRTPAGAPVKEDQLVLGGRGDEGLVDACPRTTRCPRRKWLPTRSLPAAAHAGSWRGPSRQQDRKQRSCSRAGLRK